MAEQSLQAMNSQKREEVWAVRIRQCRESGLKVKEWCAEQGLCYHTYYKWQQRLFRKYAEPAGNFYEISPVKSNGRVAVTVHTGMYSADIYGGADEETIRAVLLAIKTC